MSIRRKARSNFIRRCFANMDFGAQWCQVHDQIGNFCWNVKESLSSILFLFPPSAPFMHPSTITPFVSIHQLISYIHPSSHQNITTHIHQPTMSSINHSMVNMHQCIRIPTRVPGYVWYQDDKTPSYVPPKDPSRKTIPTKHPNKSSTLCERDVDITLPYLRKQRTHSHTTGPSRLFATSTSSTSQRCA